jgi:hypothetical protein
MLNNVVVGIVDFSARYRWPVIVIGSLLMVATACFDYARFTITTDVEALISPSLPWHQRQIALSDAFPQNGIAAVISAPTAENAEQATNALAQRLQKRPDLFRTVTQPDSGKFFEQNGLLFASIADVKRSVDGLSKAQFLVSALASDPTLRGVMKALSFVASGGRRRTGQDRSACLAALARQQNAKRSAVWPRCDILMAGTHEWGSSAIPATPTFHRDQSRS